MQSIPSLIEELEISIANGTAERRLKALWHATDLLISGADGYDDDQIALFDDVIFRLASDIEAKARAKLASRLATVANAPGRVVQILAADDDIAVARPLLTHSPRLDDADLAANARTKSQDHLLAISRRASLSESVTDVLVARGEQRVVRSVARNSGARFSDAGFRMLVKRSTGDEVLATHVGLRRDLPRHHFQKLLEKASATVRKKLTAANPQAAGAVRDVVAEIVGSLHSEVRNASSDYAPAREQVDALHRDGRLDEAEVYAYARALKFAETTVAIARLAGIPIEVAERAMLEDGPDTALILAKSAGLSWTTAKAVLLLQAADRGMSAQDLDQAMRNFTRLQPETARRVTAFYHARQRAAVPADGDLSEAEAAAAALAGA